MNLRLPVARSPLPSPRIVGDSAGAGAVPAARGLRAGFARADITPPPGFPLAGNGPEGRQAAGWRHRLYARAMALEDDRGERIAIVQVDLGHPSPVVHRLVAARTLEAGTGIGSDRLFIPHTHTHSGPGNIALSSALNAFNTPIKGYDRALVDFLVERISGAVIEAVARLRPAKAAWGRVRVDSVAVNRSLAAYALNFGGGPVPRPPVDDTLRMLRVDECDDAARLACRPKGAFSIFAVHATGYSSANDLVDGDLHAIVERELEKHIERISGREPAFRSLAFHLFANGAEGDVAPALPDGDGIDLFPPESRCSNFTRLRQGRRPGGPRSPRGPERWRITRSDLTRCLEASRLATDSTALRIHRVARELFDDLADELDSDVRIGRAYASVAFSGSRTPYPLCEQPSVGLSFAGGSDELRTRYYDWKVLGLIHTGVSEGGPAIDPDREGCHGAKRIAGGPLQPAIVGPDGFPRVVDVGVLRIGRMILATLPLEATTQVGLRIRRAVRDAFVSTGASRSDGSAETAEPLTGILGLTNGYLLYATTPEEYEAQHYEGGGTLYGPNTAPYLQHHVAELARSLAAGRPIVRVRPLAGDPGPERSFFRGPAAPAVSRPRIQDGTCDADLLRVAWIDSHPGAFRPSDGQTLRITGGDVGDEARRLPGPVWDDREDVEVRVVGPRGDGFRWRAIWRTPTAGQTYVVEVLGRPQGGDAGAAVASDSIRITCPALPSP